MARYGNKLTSKFAENISETGKYADGRGLYLVVKPTGRKLWSLRFMLHGLAREMGLGSYPDVSMAKARNKAEDARRLIEEGVDPIRDRALKQDAEAQAARKTKGAETFDECAAEYLSEVGPGWKCRKQKPRWESWLLNYVSPALGKLPVNEIETEHVLKVLQPLWFLKTDTASRIRTQIELILDFAAVKGLRSRDNPARWTKHLDKVLPSPTKVKKRKHFPSLPYSEIGQFLLKLRQETGIAARALEFLIYHPLRPSEVRGACWVEIDFEREVWTVPGPRLKGHRDAFRVPLSQPAMELLRHVRNSSDHELIFVGRSRSTALLSENTFNQLIRRLGYGGDFATSHGFRATFTTWGQEVPRFPKDLLDLCLAHAEQDKVYAAYGRSDRLEERREVAHAWAAYCLSELAKARELITPDKIVRLSRAHSDLRAVREIGGL